MVEIAPAEQNFKNMKRNKDRASLVVQHLRLLLPMQGQRFKPWSGKIPHAMEQINLCATTTEPALYSP